GADDDVGCFGRAVGKGQQHVVAAVFDFVELLVELEYARRQGVGHELVEVAAVHGQVRGAVVRQGVVAQGDLGEDVAGDAVAAVPVVGMGAGTVQFVFDAYAAHDLHDVGAQVYARAQAREGGRLFVHLDVQAGLGHKGGASRAAESGADDGEFGAAIHGVSPVGAFFLERII